MTVTLHANKANKSDHEDQHHHDQTVPEVNVEQIKNMLKENPKLASQVVEAFDQMSQLKLERAKINDQLKALRAELETKGLPLESIKIGHKLYEMTDGQVTDVIIGLMMVSNATGRNFQLDLLADLQPTTH